MATVTGIASILGSLGSSSGGNQMGYGIGSKILGPAGDPAGSIYQMIQAKKDREMKEKALRLEARGIGLEEDKWGVQKILEQQKNAAAMSGNSWRRSFMRAMSAPRG